MVKSANKIATLSYPESSRGHRRHQPANALFYILQMYRFWFFRDSANRVFCESMGRKKDPQPFLGVGGFPPEVQVKSGNQWPLLVFIGFKTFFFFLIGLILKTSSLLCWLMLFASHRGTVVPHFNDFQIKICFRMHIWLSFYLSK